jgi:drug/metabolite transporter (DMT)-like permease
VVVTGIAFILWFQGVSKVPASTAAVFTGVMPVSAVLFSYVILHQPFSWSHIWGGACVLIGLAFIVGESFAKPVNQLSNQGVNQNVCHIRYVEDNLS